jgi:hypothetical protein
MTRGRLALVAVAFLLTRLVLLPLPQPASDVGIYALYAQEYEAASRQGVSFYDLHARRVEQQIAEARPIGTPRKYMEEYKLVEYPPLALAFMRLPSLWTRGTAVAGQPAADYLEKYRLAFRLSMAIVDVGLAALVLWLVKRLYGSENGSDQLVRLLVYVASTALLWHLLYDRLDLLLAALVLLALALLYSRLHYAWSFALLAVAINFKVVPVVLAPVWIVGSMPADRRLSLRQPRVLAALGLRSALLAALVVGCFLPFYAADGSRCLDFLTYHRARGLEFESLYSSLLLAARPWSQPLDVGYSYGSINLGSSLSPVLIALAPWLMLGVLLGATALLLVHCGIGFQSCPERTAKIGILSHGADRIGILSYRGRLAHIDPHAFACYALLFFMLYIATNKVFSPQYLLWLVPLVVLVPCRGWRRRLFFWGFLLICGLSTILVPFLLSTDLIEKSSAQPPSFWVFKEPTLRMATILELRNLLFVALMSGLAIHLCRQARRAWVERNSLS